MFPLQVYKANDFYLLYPNIPLRKSFNQIKANQQHQNGSEWKNLPKKTSTNSFITTQIATEEFTFQIWRRRRSLCCQTNWFISKKTNSWNVGMYLFPLVLVCSVRRCESSPLLSFKWHNNTYFVYSLRRNKRWIDASKWIVNDSSKGSSVF